jgi:hypothetical protein
LGGAFFRRSVFIRTASSAPKGGHMHVKTWVAVAGVAVSLARSPLPRGAPDTFLPHDRTQVRCPADAFAVVRAYLTADTLGVGLSARSRDSSQIDTLGTEHFEEAPDRAYVITAFELSCLLATTDSAVFRLESWRAGTIDWDTVGSRSYKIFIPDSGTSIGYPIV